MNLYLYDKTNGNIKLIGSKKTDKVPEKTNEDSYFVLAENEQQVAQLVDALNDGKIQLDSFKWHGLTLCGVQAEQLSFITTPINRKLLD